MTNLLRVAAVLGSVVALAASASPPRQSSVSTVPTVVKSDYDAVWASVIDVVSERNWPTQNLDKNSGIVSTVALAMSDAQTAMYADCGSAPLARVRGTIVRFNFRVKESEGGTSVSVNTAFQQARSLGDQSAVVECASTGRWESELQAAIAARSKNQRPRKLQKEPTAAGPPRGFYCATSASTPNAGSCVREKAECETVRDAAVAAVADLTECTLVESAWCAGAKCAPTKDACDARGSGECAEAK